MKTHLCFGLDHGHPTIDLAVTRAAIYVVRNPLDVAISYAHHCGKDLNRTIIDMATPGLFTPASEHHLSETLGSWSQHVASWMGVAQRPVHLVRYEDMIAHPVKVFWALARYLNLKPNQAQLEAAIKRSSFAELASQEADRGFVERPLRSEKFFRAGKVGQWRAEMTPRQVQGICNAHAPMMQRMRYLPPNSGIGQ